MSGDFPKGVLRKGPMEEMTMQEEEGEFQMGGGARGMSLGRMSWHS